MVKPFCWYELRTTDMKSAATFYADVLHLRFREDGDSGVFLAGEEPVLGLSPLPEPARARGAPPHWLGQIGTGEIESYVARLVEQGAQTLGPVQRSADGPVFAALRDPFGVPLAVSARTHRPEQSPVSWHQLHTTDFERSWSIYAELFGWSALESVPGIPLGPHRLFVWEAGGPSIGIMADTARHPGTHTHWLFFFRVPDLDAALERIRVRGGEVLTPVRLPNGDHLVACHDPQRGAFGLHMRVSAAACSPQKR